MLCRACGPLLAAHACMHMLELQSSQSTQSLIMAICVLEVITAEGRTNAIMLADGACGPGR